MQLSTDRILTTHTGSLPRPKPLIDLILGRERGGGIDTAEFDAQAAKAVDDIVAQQIAAGIDVVSDGEMSKPSYTTYIRHRVAGIEPDPRAAEKGRDIMIGRDLLAHPDFADRRRNFSDMPVPGCVGPLRYQDRRAQHRSAQCCDGWFAGRPHAAAYLLGQLRGTAHSRPAADENHRHRLQGAPAGDQHRSRQSTPRP